MPSGTVQRNVRVGYVCWEGVDLSTSATEEEKAAFLRSYDRARLRDTVETNRGVVRGTRYELALPDPRGDPGPYCLTVYETVDHEALLECVNALAESAVSPGSASTPASPDALAVGVRWRMAFASLGTEPGGAEPLPYLQVIGMDLPPTTDTKLIEDFNIFYSETHVPEVLSAFDFELGHRFELVSGVVGPNAVDRSRDDGKPTPRGLPPRYVATYEARIPIDIHGASSDYPWSEGPAVWRARRTRWRLLYRMAWSHARSKADG